MKASLRSPFQVPSPRFFNFLFNFQFSRELGIGFGALLITVADGPRPQQATVQLEGTSVELPVGDVPTLTAYPVLVP